MTGILMVAVGIVCLYFNRRRKFDRTNPFGVEQFPSYFRKLSAIFGDWMLLAISVFCVICGLLILADEHQDTWGGWVLALVYGWMLSGYVPTRRRWKS